MKPLSGCPDGRRRVFSFLLAHLPLSAHSLCLPEVNLSADRNIRPRYFQGHVYDIGSRLAELLIVSGTPSRRCLERISIPAQTRVAGIEFFSSFVRNGPLVCRLRTIRAILDCCRLRLADSQSHPHALTDWRGAFLLGSGPRNRVPSLALSADTY